MIEELTNLLLSQFNGRLKVQEKRPGIYQLFLPFYYEDGDMMEIYLQKEGGLWKICDHGMALMRLTYHYKVDTENKEKIFQKIIAENGACEENGNIFMTSDDDRLYTSLLQYVTCAGKVSSMRFFRREVIESLFYEMLEEYVFSELQRYKPEKEIQPIAERDDLEADFSLRANGYPIYLYGVKDVAKARLTTISCLEFQKHQLKFRSFVVHEDFEKLPGKDRTRLTSACDKQFVTLDDFCENAVKFLEKER